MLPLVFALAYGGFLALAMAMPRHSSALAAGIAVRPKTLRVVGAALLIGSLLAGLAIWNAARAIPAVIGIVSLGAFGTAMAITFAPHRAVSIAVALLFLSLAAAAIG